MGSGAGAGTRFGAVLGFGFGFGFEGTLQLSKRYPMPGSVIR